MPRRAAQMPDRLARSAFALFSRRGIANVGVDAIAAAAGVTKGSLYWHYESKDDLIKAACGHYYRAYHRRINAAIARVADPVKRLERALRTAVRICLLDDRNRVFTTEIFTLAAKDEELRRGWRQFSDGVRELYLGLVDAARATGRIVPADPAQAVDFMLSTMEGTKLRALYEPHICARKSEEAIVENLQRTLGFK